MGAGQGGGSLSEGAHSLTPFLTRIFALACGLAAANLYYAQPMLGIIGQSFAVGSEQTSLIVTFTQLGYAVGLLLVVPLGDMLENRRLITTVMLATVVALLGVAAAPSLVLFTGLSLLVGVTSVVTQILVPFAAHLAPPEQRGQVVGKVMSGLLLGILLARAAAGLASGWVGWRGVYAGSALLMLGMAALLRVKLPQRRPERGPNYGQLLASLKDILLAEPRLRRRAFYQWLMFGAFSLFWTSITYLLTDAPFHYPQSYIGVFALVGAVGALAAPAVGKLGDRGYGRQATGAAFVIGAVGFGLTLLQTRIWALALGAILLDLAVQTTLVLGQQVIYSLNPEQRSRLNTLYISIFFTGGAVGSAVAGVLYTHGGWPWVAGVGLALPLVGLLAWLTERNP